MLTPDARIVIGVFAEDGPERCSGLATERYSPDALVGALGSTVELLASRRELPSNAVGGDPAVYLGGAASSLTGK